MCALPKVNQSRSRLVVVTHGKEPAIAVKGKLPFFGVKVHWIDVLISLNICSFLVQIVKQVFSITFFFARRVSRHSLLTVSPTQSRTVESIFVRAGNRIFREQRRISGSRFSSTEERSDLGKRVSVRKLETGEPVEKLSSHVV